MGKDSHLNTNLNAKPEEQHVEFVQKKGHFAKCCNSNQVANVEQPEPDEEEDCNFIVSDTEENYSVLKISDIITNGSSQESRSNQLRNREN